MDDEAKRAEIARLQAELDEAERSRRPVEADVQESGDPPAQQPAWWRQWWVPVAGVAALGTIIALAVWFASADERKAKADAEAAALIEAILDSSDYEVVYRVDGSAESVSITMETPTGTSQQDHLEVPLKRANGEPMSFTFGYGDFVYISAQNEGETGTVTCTIEVDGRVISTAQSSGAYVIASCDGSVGTD